MWFVARTQAGPQIHQPLRISLDFLFWQQGLGQCPQGALNWCRAGKPFDAEAARQYPLDVAVENRCTHAESKYGNRRRRRTSDARQSGQRFRRLRKLPAIFITDKLCATVQIARPCVVAQPCPVFEHRIQRRLRQRRDLRKRFKKASVIGNDGRDLCLLQHDFRQPHPIGITPPLPGQIMATLLLLPDDQVFRKWGHPLQQCLVVSWLEPG